MKWRSILITTLAVIVLGVILYWLNTKSRESTFTAANTEFALKDTAAIDEIHLSNLQGQEVILKQQPDHQWMVNNKFQASQTKIETLLHTIYHVEVKKPVPLESRENVIKSLATQNVQVDIYQDGNLVRSYYVGHQTPSELGTYMAMNNEDKKPYVTHIPGFYGYLSSRYFCDPDEWRSTLIWNFNPAAIQEVKVAYPKGEKEPFHLLKEGENAFTIKHLKRDKALKNYALKQVKRYLMNFRDFHCVRDMNDSAKRDSLLQYNPNARLTVKDETDNKRSLAVYKAFGNAKDTANRPRKPNNYFAITPRRENQVVLIQNLQIEPMLKGFSHFESSKNN